MRRQRSVLRVMLAAVFCAILWSAAPARGEAADYSVAAPSRFALRLLAELRLARVGPAPSWIDRGPAKTPYGGARDSHGFDHRVRFALNRISFEPSLALPWGILAAAQLDWRGDVDTHGHIENDGWPRLIEALLRREWGEYEAGWSAQVGVINPPLSLESDGPAWTPLRTLTPAAATSWLWQEGRVVGMQLEWWRSLDRIEVTAFAGSGWGPDQAGVLIARRGWVLDDALYGINSGLPLPAAGAEARVFDERDGRPAIYGGLIAREASGWLELSAGYFDNLGDLGVHGVWETRYGTMGLRSEPLPGFELIAQGLVGKTTVRGDSAASDFWAWYPLLSYRRGAHRLSARYDDFHVGDADGGTLTGENGWAVTIAYLYELGLRHRFGVEWIHTAGNRAGARARDDGGFQISYRYRY